MQMLAESKEQKVWCVNRNWLYDFECDFKRTITFDR